jgi:hypothetical protein
MLRVSDDMIDIAMTAVLRPSIFEETILTIKKCVCQNELERYRLIINIDCIGEDVRPSKIVKIAKKNFSTVISNVSFCPSFPRAVKWVWSTVTAPYVFHWEDDVNILRKIDVNNMIRILKKYKKLSSLRLYKQSTPKRNVIRTFSCKWIYNEDGFFVAKDWKAQFGLNPILIKKEFIDQALPKMRDDINPEKQFRAGQSYMRSVIKDWNYGLYTKPGESRLVDGRKGQKWKNEVGLDKPIGRTFIEWIKIGD